jgi:hypothetical protein
MDISSGEIKVYYRELYPIIVDPSLCSFLLLLSFFGWFCFPRGRRELLEMADRHTDPYDWLAYKKLCNISKSIAVADMTK